MRIAAWTVSKVLAACLAAGAMASCDSDAGPDASADASPEGSPSETAAQQVEETDPSLDDLAADASDAAQDIGSPLLVIVNKTSETVVLTSADGRTTNTVGPGRSVQLVSQRVCRWIPMTASTEDGQFLEEYAEPCRGQTWTITDD